MQATQTPTATKAPKQQPPVKQINLGRPALEIPSTPTDQELGLLLARTSFMAEAANFAM